uniref:Protein transport protein SEC31-like isoform X2 n=1 Tax=Petromyzon marinus TaxID=7757 RepID=A0AAJ7STF1_PETMA|nr:protein transport protein SEC31-like isoform X2 [Petromyzon marinus]
MVLNREVHWTSPSSATGCARASWQNVGTLHKIFFSSFLIERSSQPNTPDGTALHRRFLALDPRNFFLSSTVDTESRVDQASRFGNIQRRRSTQRGRVQTSRMPVKAPMYLKPGRTSKGKKAARLRDILSGDMISPPLGDFRHVAHVGSSGGMGERAAAFGDLSFLWSERRASRDEDGVLQRAERRRAVPEARLDRDLASGPGHQAARGTTCFATGVGIPSPVLRNAFVLPYTGPEQALVLPGVSPFCPGGAGPPRRRPEPPADTEGGAGDDANGEGACGREDVAGAGTSRSTSGGVVRAAASPPPRVNRLACPDAKGPCTSPSPKRGLLRSIRDQVQNITLSPPLSRSRNFQSVHACETSSQEPLLLSSNDMHREEEQEEGGEEGSSRAFRFMSFSGNGFSHRRLTGVTASCGKPQQPKATARAAAGQLSTGPEWTNPRLPSREGCARNGFASTVDHEQPGCLWPRTPERVAVTESMHFLRSRQTLHPRSKRRDMLAKSRRENGDEHRQATAAAACPSHPTADNPRPGAWPDNSKSPPTPSPSVSPPPPPPPPPPPQRSQRGDLQARGAGGRGEWAEFSTLARTRWPPGEPHGAASRCDSSESLLSLHTDLGPSMLDDVLGVMERQEGRGPRRASARYAKPDGTLGKGATAITGGSEHGVRGAERDSGVACEASASAENLLRHFSPK